MSQDFATVSCRSHAALSSWQPFPYSSPLPEYDSINAAAAPLVSAPRACGGGGAANQTFCGPPSGLTMNKSCQSQLRPKIPSSTSKNQAGQTLKDGPLLNTFTVSVSQTLTFARLLLRVNFLKISYYKMVTPNRETSNTSFERVSNLP